MLFTIRSIEKYFFNKLVMIKRLINNNFIPLIFFCLFILISVWTFKNAPDYFIKLGLERKYPIDKTGQTGDTFGGTLTPIIAWLAALLTFAAFWVQYQANLLIRHNSIKEQIEGRFFELLKIHITNRDNIINNDKDFIYLLEEFNELTFSFEAASKKYNDFLTDEEIRKISYDIFFYGAFNKTSTGNLSFQHISSILRKHLEKYASEIGNEFQKTLVNKYRIPEDELMKKYKGHQNTLGHYFRHLFQTVKFINNQPPHILNYREKYQYIKTLRAQMSTSEQILFFYNSLSDLGRKWEFEKNLNINDMLITKYNLIKNIPVDIIRYPNNIKNKFPLIVFESDATVSAERIKLESMYI